MKPQKKLAMTRSDMRDALLRSGYLLEMRVQALLEANKWHAQTSYAYPDPTTGKSREMDVWAFRGAGKEVEPWIGGLSPVYAHLFAECVNNPHAVVLIMKTTDEKFRSVEFPFTGAPQFVLDQHPLEKEKQWWWDLPHVCDWNTFHHYASGSVASQYCSFMKKKQSVEWMAHHEEHHFDSIEKLCDVLENRLRRSPRRMRMLDPRPDIDLQYPVLILEGDLYEARSGKKGVRLKKVPHSKLVRRLSRDGRTIEYIIDVVTERGLPAFVEILNRELMAVAAKLTEHQDKVNDAIQRYIAAAENLTAEERVELFRNHPPQP